MTDTSEQKTTSLKRTVAIVLAAGQGKRMQSGIAKQFIPLCGKPVLCYSLDAFEKSGYVDDVVIVASPDGISVCEEIVREYGYKKVSSVVPGGKERYHSVYYGLKAFLREGETAPEKEPEFVLIHDGARPFVTEDIIKRNIEALKKDRACVTGVPTKDTVKIANEEGYVESTPKRSLVWNVQTPQSFSFALAFESYNSLIQNEEDTLNEGILITDDTMVVEQFGNVKAKLVEGSYENIKITTPDDLILAEKILADRG